MLYVRFAQAFQPDRCNALDEPKKPCLHIGRKSNNLPGDGFVEDFYSPWQQPLISQF